MLLGQLAYDGRVELGWGSDSASPFSLAKVCAHDVDFCCGFLHVNINGKPTL